MAKYNIHAGHCPQGKGASGASDLLQESIENRLIKDEMIRLLKLEGHTVYDCTCDTAETQSGCLNKIIKKCNEHTVTLDISVHLNSGRNDKKGDDKIGGFETYAYSNTGVKKEVSERMRKNMKSLGFTDRGSKTSSTLRFLKSSKSPALLIEVCFVDDKDDFDLYEEVGYKAIAKALVEALIDKEIDGTILAGSKVKIKSGASYGGASAGKKVSTAYIGKQYAVKKVQKNNGQQEALIKELNSWVPIKYLTI